MKSGGTGEPVMTRDGDQFWATTMEPEGWVEATSVRVTDRVKAPADLLTFETEGGRPRVRETLERAPLVVFAEII